MDPRVGLQSSVSSADVGHQLAAQASVEMKVPPAMQARFDLREPDLALVQPRTVWTCGACAHSDAPPSNLSRPSFMSREVVGDEVDLASVRLRRE